MVCLGWYQFRIIGNLWEESIPMGGFPCKGSAMLNKFPNHDIVMPFIVLCSLHVLTADSSHYNDVRMSAMASQITSLTIVYSTVYSGAYQIKYQSSASLAFVVNSPRKWLVTRKMFPCDDVIMHVCFQDHFSIIVPSHPNYLQTMPWTTCILQTSAKLMHVVQAIVC